MFLGGRALAAGPECDKTVDVVPACLHASLGSSIWTCRTRKLYEESCMRFTLEQCFLEQVHEYCWLTVRCYRCHLALRQWRVDSCTSHAPLSRRAEGWCCSGEGVDTSAPALDLARRNAEANGLGEDLCTFQQADVMDVMKMALAERRQYDVVVLDPPKLAPNRKSLQRASHR